MSLLQELLQEAREIKLRLTVINLAERFSQWNTTGRRFDAAVTGLGLPVRLIRVPGQASNVTQANPSIEGLPFEVVIAEKGDDSPVVVASVEDQNGEAVVPSRSNATSPRKTDGAKFKDRNGVECF